MKKLLYPLAFALTAFLILYSCSAEEEDTTPPPQVQQPTPEPEPEVSQFTLTVSAGEGGTVSTEGGTFDEGTEVTITATADEGFVFSGWEGNDSNSDSLTITVNSETTIQAIFSQAFSLEINQGEGGSIIGEAGTYGSDTEITIEAVPSAGFEFMEWSNGSTDNPLKLVLTSNTQLTPLFQRKIDFISKYSGKIFIGEVDQYGNQYERYFTRDTLFGRTSFVDNLTGDKLCWDQEYINTSIYTNPLYEVYEDSLVWSGGYIITDGYRDTLGTRNGSHKILNSSVYKIRVEDRYYSGEISITESVFTISDNHVCDELSF